MSTLQGVLRRTWARAALGSRNAVNDAVVQAALAAMLTAVYAATLLPGAGYSGDSAKFQFLGHVLGTGHPPGEPVYLVTLAAFDRLVPVGTPALRANVLSAVLGVGVALLLYRLLRALGHRTLTAFAITASLALMPTFWSQAVVAEVYTLSLLVLTAVLLLLVRWRSSGCALHLYAALALYALSVAVHSMTVLFAPAVVLLLWPRRREVVRDPRAYVAVVVGLGAALAAYGYIWWRTLDPSTGYLEAAIHDPRSFLDVLTGSQFHSWMFAFSLRDVVTTRIPAFLHLLGREYLFLLPVAMFGLVVRFDRRRPVDLALITVAILDIVFAVNYDAPDVPVFFLPAYLVLSVWAARGLEALLDLLAERRVRPRWGPGLSAAPALVAAVPLVFGAVNLGHVDQHADTDGARRAHAIAEGVLPGAVVYPGSYTWAQLLWYETLGEGAYRRRGVLVASYKSDLDDLVDYLDGEQLPIWEQRVYAPPGRPVYLLHADDAAALRRRGLRVRPERVHGEPVWRVLRRPPLPSRLGGI